MPRRSRSEEHRLWLATFGFSDEDRRRIRQLALDLTDTYTPPALVDLSVPIGVRATKANPRYLQDRLGVITQPGGLKVALSYWRMDPHEITRWETRRGGR